MQCPHAADPAQVGLLWWTEAERGVLCKVVNESNDFSSIGTDGTDTSHVLIAGVSVQLGMQALHTVQPGLVLVSMLTSRDGLQPSL